MSKSIFLGIFILSILFAAAVYAEDDAESKAEERPVESMTPFTQKWTFSIFSNYNLGVFEQTNTPQYRTDKPLNAGFGIRYRIFSFSTSFSIPVAVTESSSATDLDFAFSSYMKRMYLEGYFKYYKNFYEVDTREPGGLEALSSGLRFTFVHNYKDHFISSAINLDKRQNISSGSFLYGFGIFYSSLNSTAEAIQNHSGKTNLLFAGPGFGYSYIWVFGPGFFVNVSFVAVASSGFNLGARKLITIPQLEPNIAFGYHHHTRWSINVKMLNRTSFLFWDPDLRQNPNEVDYTILSLTTMGVMFAVRL
jgi:hypothetical protein